jgi:hypothetical protein
MGPVLLSTPPAPALARPGRLPVPVRRTSTRFLTDHNRGHTVSFFRARGAAASWLGLVILGFRVLNDTPFTTWRDGSSWGCY